MAVRKYANAEEKRLARNARKRTKNGRDGHPNHPGRPWQHFTVEEARAARAENQRLRRAKVREFVLAQQENGQDISTSGSHDPSIIPKLGKVETSEQQRQGPGRPRKYANDEEYKAAIYATEREQRAAYSTAIRAAKEPIIVVKRKPGRPRIYKDEEEARQAKVERRRMRRAQRKLEAQSESIASADMVNADKTAEA